MLLHIQDPDRLKQTKGSDGIGIGRVFGGFKADLDMALCGQIINLGRLDLLNQADQIRAVGEIADRASRDRSRRRRGMDGEFPGDRGGNRGLWRVERGGT